MRADISPDRFRWIYKLDYKKLIAIVFLLRLISASAYDIYVSITDKDILLPDSKFYSLKGRYIDLVLRGYGNEILPFTLMRSDKDSREIFFSILEKEKGKLPPIIDESVAYAYVIGIIYYILGYATIWIRLFIICISILSVYLLFRVAKQLFGDLAANLFLILALFLPTQFGYSITLSRDFLRVFIVSFSIWMIYEMGGIWIRK